MILFTYAFVNMGMVSGILPVVGVPLPLVTWLRQHGAGDAVPGHRHPDEHPEAPQAGADLNALRSLRSSIHVLGAPAARARLGGHAGKRALLGRGAADCA